MNVRNGLLMVLLLSAGLLGCDDSSLTLSGLKVADFQTERDGKLTNLYVLKNKNGMEVCVTNYGARVVSIMAPDRNGKSEDVVNGFPTIKEYMDQSQNFGSTVGRYIGRILNATFTLDSITYHLTPNTGQHSAHGGNPGFAAKIWDAEQLDPSAIKLSYLSIDGENGFPGNLDVSVVYRLTDDNELDITYEAKTDKPTVVNLSHHSFFNISGDLAGTIEDEILYVNADYFTPYDSTKCVTGEFAAVEGTPFDFTVPERMGSRMDEDDPQLNLARGGYDHCFVLNTKGDVTKLAASVYDEKSGRILEVYTNEPGLQVYTAEGLRGKLVGKKGIAYPKRNSICLETMHFQDSPNKPQFPSTVLRPGEKYYSRCVYRFGVKL
ncbi:aldose epimerase family protein [Bacteroides sp. 51]|uniref:aldose epimerase family protein n=1 Tax=Bacteroides sp. 51 TaxID=2302938 RepID=UPI0013D3A3FA|nr:aldose epimerase family protein [Bacteroides sp. 51]NDV82890.1 galactose mutarotase [Bacteroides sp. 51]